METMLPGCCQHTLPAISANTAGMVHHKLVAHLGEAAMIARLWRGAANGGNAALYRTHFNEAVLPHLRGLAGFGGAWLLQRQADGETEFLAVTLWTSTEAIAAFTGPDIEVAVVEPEARAVLVRADDFATHFEVAIEAGPQR
jgi:heme-degrading monooxygenase HmoA